MTFSLQPLPVTQRKVYALLVESLDDEHEVSVIRGVINGAREVGATVLCVAGAAVDDPDPDRRARNLAFDLISPSNCQGAMVVTSAIGLAQGVESLKPWMARFDPLPVCCVGIPIDGYASVQVDNFHGMKALVTHLIADHGASKIAYVNGPLASSEVHDRFEAFASALKERDIEVNPDWVVQGDFTKASGVQAIRTLLDERGATELDAIVAANDFMALGAMDELSQRGIRVPDEVQIVGFDDVESARRARPELTTVAQPGEALGRQGVQLLTQVLAGNPPPAGSTARLHTELVLRESCGCLSLDAANALGLSEAEEPSAVSFEGQRQTIIDDMIRASKGSFRSVDPGWEGRLLDALISDVRGQAQGSFAGALHQLLLQAETKQLEPRMVQAVLSALRRQSLRCVTSDPSARAVLEAVLHDARVFVGSFAGQAQANLTRALHDRFRDFRSSFRSRMFGAATGLSRSLADHLPDMGVEACLVAAFAEPDEVNSEASIVFGFSPDGSIASPSRCSIKTLPNSPLLGRSGRPQVLLPLVFDGEAIGATVMSVRELNGDILEELMELFAVAAKIRAELALAETAQSATAVPTQVQF